MSRLEYVVDFITKIVGDKTKAQIVVERLQDEGLLHLGYGDAEVDMIVAKFSKTFGTTKTSKYDRFASGRLAKKYGAQAIVGIIGLLGGLREEKYAPVVNNLTEMEDKIVSIIAFLRKQSDKGDVDA